MPCGCGQRGSTPSAFGLAKGSVQITDQGMIMLASTNGCTEPYHGQYQGASVYVVGLGTDAEAVYLKADNKRALRDARARRTTFDHLPARQLCHERMVELLGG